MIKLFNLSYDAERAIRQNGKLKVKREYNDFEFDCPRCIVSGRIFTRVVFPVSLIRDKVRNEINEVCCNRCNAEFLFEYDGELEKHEKCSITENYDMDTFWSLEPECTLFLEIQPKYKIETT